MHVKRCRGVRESIPSVFSRIEDFVLDGVAVKRRDVESKEKIRAGKVRWRIFYRILFFYTELFNHLIERRPANPQLRRGPRQIHIIA